jgi:hypothetical protein
MHDAKAVPPVDGPALHSAVNDKCFGRSSLRPARASCRAGRWCRRLALRGLNGMTEPTTQLHRTPCGEKYRAARQFRQSDEPRIAYTLGHENRHLA